MRGKRPKITWGAAFANTITFPTVLDEALNYPLPAEGSEWLALESGVEEAWITGERHFLEGVVRRIPIAATGGITGWDGATGWAAFLSWARDKNQFRFYPDKDVASYLPCYLVEPVTEHGSRLERGAQFRALRLRIRTADGTPFTGY